jgi:hypothetical protein
MAIAAAVNSGRVVAWFDEFPRAKTRTSPRSLLSKFRD